MRLAESQSGPKRRRFIFGPGTIGAVVIVIALVVSGKLPGLRQEDPPPPIAPPSASVDISPTDRQGPTPDVRFIADRAGELGLSQEQTRRLAAVQARSKSELGPLEREMDAAGKDFEGWLRSHAAKSAPAGDLSDASRQFSVLSGKVAHLREVFWKEAVAVLTPVQARILKTEREREWKRTLDRLDVKGEPR